MYKYLNNDGLLTPQFRQGLKIEKIENFFKIYALAEIANIDPSGVDF